MTLGPNDHGQCDEPVDALLRTGTGPCDVSPIRETTLARTIGVIRFRRHVRKCILAASLAGCYAAGLATAGLQTRARHEAPSPQAAPSPSPGPRGLPRPAVAPARLSREEIVRRDADRSLLERGDVKKATRQYALYLKLASADQRASSPEQDSWLLMALKDARSRELKHDRVKQD